MHTLTLQTVGLAVPGKWDLDSLLVRESIRVQLGRHGPATHFTVEKYTEK